MTYYDESAATLSVVVPMYNEEPVVSLTMRRLRTVLDELGHTYEVLAVDDGSVDATVATVAALRPGWPELRLLRLRRNRGHQAALTAGLFRARGRYVVSIDADLQDPPELIGEMLRLATVDGVDVVYGVRSDRSLDRRFKRWTAAAYYRLMRRLVGPGIPANAGDFRLLSRTAVELLRDLPERAPVLRLVVPWLGLPSAEVTYQRQERAAGNSKYPLATMVRLAVDSVTGFSAAPLRLATWLGAGGIALCVPLAVAAVIAYATGSAVPGWTSVYLAVLFLAAVQLLCLGLLGEYVGRIYTAVLARPAYHIESDTLADTTGRPNAGTAVGP